MSNNTLTLHLFGASGAGVTSLGKAVAERMEIPHFDTDNYHWFTDDALPYRRRRNPEHRRKLMEADLAGHPSWVLTGALCGWGDVFIPRFQAVVFCELPTPQRLARIREREMARYGAERLAPGGDLHLVYEKFCAWAATYEEESNNLRSRQQELIWLSRLSCPVIKINTDAPLPALTDAVLEFTARLSIKKI
jgi:adenylate kinase family enzyme